MRSACSAATRSSRRCPPRRSTSSPRGRSLRFAAGDEIVREGKAGDRFYVVASGEVGVSIDGVETGTLAVGDSFGEIALLRDVPRTATVAARSDVELLAVERDAFLAAVTGHAPSAEVADAVVAARLGSLRPTAAVD